MRLLRNKTLPFQNILILKDQRGKSGPDGTARYFLDYVDELFMRGFKVFTFVEATDTFLITNLKKKKITFYKMPDHRPRLSKPLSSFKNITYYRNSIVDLVRRENIQVIDLHHHSLCHLVSKSINCFVLSHKHDALSMKQLNVPKFKSPFKNFLHSLKRQFTMDMSKTDLVTCPSLDSKKTAIAQFNLKPKDIFVSPHGTTGKFLFKPFLSNSSSLKIITCGIFTKSKGCEEFCKVAETLYRTHPKEFEFIHIGFVNKNDLEIKAIYQKYKSFVKFAGVRDDVEKIMSKGFIYLHLSHREAGSRAMFEAKSTSLPIIGWDVVGVREFIKNDVNGYICKFGDLEDVKAKIVLLAKKKDQYNVFRRRSYEDFSTNYRFKKHIDRLLNKVNEDILASKTKP